MVGGKLSDDLERAVSALHDPTRRAILLDFYMTGAERTVDDVAKAARVHRTVAFSHLERLAALGYLSTSQLRGKSGKPAKLYRLTARPIELSYESEGVWQQGNPGSERDRPPLRGRPCQSASDIGPGCLRSDRGVGLRLLARTE